MCKALRHYGSTHTQVTRPCICLFPTMQVLGFDLPLPTHVSEPTLTAYIFDVETETNCPQ